MPVLVFSLKLRTDRPSAMLLPFFWVLNAESRVRFWFLMTKMVRETTSAVVVVVAVAVAVLPFVFVAAAVSPRCRFL